MSKEQLLPQEKPISSMADELSVLRDKKVFDIASASFINFDELIKTSSVDLNIEYEIFFSNSPGTQWGYMKVVGGKIVKTIPLLEINILSVIKINPNGLNVEGYLVKYCQSTMYNVTEEYIPEEDVKRYKLLQHFSLPPQGSKNKDDLCNRLLNNIILGKIEKGDQELHIEIGKLQGWNFISENKIVFECKEKYPEALYPIVPKSIIERERPKNRHRSDASKRKIEELLYSFFDINTELRVIYLIRMSSYNLTFSHSLKIDFDQITVIKPSETVTSDMLTALLKNDSFSSNDVLTLAGKTKSVKEKISQRSDGILLVVDETKADEPERRKGNIELLESAVVSKAKDNHFIPVIISKYASTQVRSDICISFTTSNFKCSCEPSHIKPFLEWNDARFLSKTERNFQKYAQLYQQNFRRVSLTIPASIPQNRKQAYIILVATARTYNEFYDYFFGENVERFIVDWLSDYTEHGTCIDEDIIKDFGICLNQEISSGKFHYIKRKKYNVIDKGTNSAIIDDDNIYIETNIIKELVQNKMQGLHSVDSLTDILKANGYLESNEQNSKSYRFRVQSSDGEPYMLYTYGISLQLINAENRKKFELADKEKFLLTREELKESNLLPLGITLDGRYIGKDISFDNRSNDSIFVTGQSGKGKTFCASNLLPSLAMLGNRVVVLDVSGSFTREELLRALPLEVVDTLFEFINVGEEKGKFPINPLVVADCTGLPKKKRRIFGLIKAAAGTLDDDVSKIVMGVISDMLQQNGKAPAINIGTLRNTLKNGGKESKKVYELISSTLDDIEKIGCAEQGWSELFESSKKILVISLGDESDEKVHSLLDLFVSSLYEWQRYHKTTPLTIVVDEIKKQNFEVGSPLHTLITEGRKFGAKLIGITQDYIPRGNRNINVMREADIKIFFEPANSRETIAAELGYKNAANACFGNLGKWEFILKSDCYSKEDLVNERLVITLKVLDFVDSPLYEKFKELFDNRED